MTDIAKRPAILLFAHGARDSRWADPFLLVANQVRAADSALAVELAYLEHLSPSFDEGVRLLAERGAKVIRVVPLFFGRGGHLRVEVPELVRQTAAKLPELTIELALPAGEDSAVIAALAAYCLRAADGPPPSPTA